MYDQKSRETPTQIISNLIENSLSRQRVWTFPKTASNLPPVYTRTKMQSFVSTQFHTFREASMWVNVRNKDGTHVSANQNAISMAQTPAQPSHSSNYECPQSTDLQNRPTAVGKATSIPTIARRCCLQISVAYMGGALC